MHLKAIQTYDNDDKVKWTGKENSEHQRQR